MEPQARQHLRTSVLRFQYQLARALQHIDKERAFALLQQLTQKRYPAAFDNLGWLFLARRNIAQAVSHFRIGAQLGDPDSMMSFVEMYDTGVRRDKAALFSGCKPHPATAPAGSDRSSHGGNEVAEAFD